MEIVARHHRWQAERYAELEAPDSWLGLVALTWLEQGENTVGSDPLSAIALPRGVARLGSLWLEGDTLYWESTESGVVEVSGGGEWLGQRQRIQADRLGPPSLIAQGSLVFFVIERDGRYAVRVRDREWMANGRPAPLSCYPYDPAWRVDASWQGLASPLEMAVPNVSGDLMPVRVEYQAVFEYGGRSLSLLPMSVGERELFFVFRDQGSGRETYGAGRFLKVPLPVDGKITLDFNFAYNPPCAFTPFATCPLPPPENWLPFAVTAGEKRWLSHPEQQGL